MSFKITLQPSGREFEAHAGQTLLEAALASGVNVTYNCNNGTCGGCLIKVLKGRVGQVDFHDYVIPEALRAQGYELVCRAHPGSDMVVQAQEATSAADIPHQELNARVARFEHLGEHIRILYLRTPRTNTLRFLAGQHVQLTLGNGLDRDMAIASCPCNGQMLQFHVRCDPKEPFLVHAFDNIHIGDAIRVSGPFGRFNLDDESRRAAVFIAQDTGFGPIKSLIEHAIALDHGQPIHLIWLATTAAGHYQANQARAWNDALDEFSFLPLTLNRLENSIEELFERMLEALPPLHTCDIYISAKEHSLPLRDLLLAAGTPRGQLHVDDTRHVER